MPAPSPDTPQVVPEFNSRTVAAAIRLAAGVAFLGVVVAWTWLKSASLRVPAYLMISPMLVYVAAAAAALLVGRRAQARRFYWFMPFFDIGLTFFLLHEGQAVDTLHGASWAVISLGIYTLLVVLAGLCLSSRLAILHTLLCIAATYALLAHAKLSFWPVLASAITLAFVSLADSLIPQLADAVARQGQQTAHAMASLDLVREQNQQLERLQREKDALLEVFVHDMRNPVGAALLSLEYLAMELKKVPSQAVLLEATDDALSTLTSLGGMISQILDTAKLESGRMTLHMDHMELRPLLEAAHKAVLPRARSRSITFDMEAPESLCADVDQRLFPRLLEVLLTHLLRHTPEGGRLLLVATGDASLARVSFHSTMSIVPEGQRDTLFDKFPPSPREPRRTNAPGLGLYFCRLVASAHQGSIGIEDVSGWGTSFVLRLPSQRQGS